MLADLLALPWTKVTEEGWAICEVPGHTPLESGTEREKPGVPWRPGSGRDGGGHVEVRAAARPPDAAAAITWAAAQVKKIQDEVDARREHYRARRQATEDDQRARAQRWANRPVEHRVDHGRLALCYRHKQDDVDRGGRLYNTGYKVAYYDELARFVPKQLAEAEALCEQQEALREQQVALRKEQKALREQDWIGEHGTPSQKARHAAKRLPSRELYRAIHDWCFAPLSAWPEYEHEHEHDEDWLEADEDEADEEEVDEDSEDLPITCSESEYEALNAISTALKSCPADGDGTIVLQRRQVGGRKTIVAKVQIIFAGRTFLRLIPLGASHG